MSLENVERIVNKYAELLKERKRKINLRIQSSKVKVNIFLQKTS